MVEAGKELEFVMHRLKDVIFIGERCEAVRGEDPKAVQRMMVKQAQMAMPYLEIALARINT